MATMRASPARERIGATAARGRHPGTVGSLVTEADVGMETTIVGVTEKGTGTATTGPATARTAIETTSRPVAVTGTVTVTVIVIGTGTAATGETATATTDGPATTAPARRGP